MNITDYNPNFQNQRAPPEIASFRSRLGTVQNQNTSNLAPIQTAFRQLAKDSLFQSSIGNKTDFKAESSAQWTMARAEALFDAVYASGQTNDRDMQQIHELSREIDTLEKKLKIDRNLSPEQKRLDQKCLGLARTALTELAYFPEALRQYQSIQGALDHSLDHMVDTMYSPLYPGESLSAFFSVSQACESLLALEMQIEHLPENSSVGLRLQENLNTQLSAFSFYLYEWHEEIDNYMQQETKDLLQLYETCPPQKKEEVARQIAALEVQQSHLKKQLEGMQERFKNSGPVRGTLRHILEDVSKDLYTALSKLKSGMKRVQVPSSTKVMTFGDEEWAELSIQRENDKRTQKEKNATIFDNLIDTFSHPENWSDDTKSIVFRLLTAMQLGQQALEFSQKLSQADYLRQQAEAASRKVSSETQHTIDRVNARLGILLSDKYEQLLNDPQLIERFAKGDDLLHEGIREALGYFKSDAPNRQQLFQYLDAFRSKQYAKISSSPFSHLSISEWVGLFTKCEEESSSTSQEPVSAQNANQKTDMVPRRTIGLMGNEPQFSTMIESEKAMLMQAKSSLNEEAQKIAKESMDPVVKQQNQHIASLQEEIHQLEQNAPIETSTLTELARWMQSIEDVRFEIVRTVQNVAVAYTYRDFFRSIINADVDSLKKLLRAGSYPDLSHKVWENIYHEVISFGDSELITLLKEIGVPINAKNIFGETPLTSALKHGRNEIVKSLLKNGAIPKKNIDKNLFDFAMKTRDSELINILAEIGYNEGINEINTSGTTYLIAATIGAVGNKADLISALIKAGADPDIQVAGGNTALHFAAFIGDEISIKSLLASNANAQLINEKGNTPDLFYKRIFPDRDQSLFEDNDYSKTFLNIKSAAHALELAGTLPLAGKQLKLEGSYTQYFAQIFGEYVGLFANQYSGLKEIEVRMLQEVLKEGIEYSTQAPQKIYEDYKAGKPILIFTGYLQHAVSVYLQGEYIIVGNKGAYTNKPLEVYKINASKVTKEFIELTKKMGNGQSSQYKKWIKNLPSTLEGTLERLGTAIEKGYPLEKEQTVGNCSWESTETILFGILALKRLQANPEASPSEIIKDVQKTFTEMTQFFQLESFENFLKAYLCEYHTGVPQQLGDREHFMIMKQSAYQHFATFPDTFAEKVAGIKALLALDPEGKV